MVPGAEGPHNLLPHTGQHVAGLYNQAMANCARVVSGDDSNLIKELLLFERAKVQYRCVECSRSVDVACNFGERTPQEHRTGDGSNVQQSAQVGKRTEPAAGAEAHGRWPTPDPDRSTDATVLHQ